MSREEQADGMSGINAEESPKRHDGDGPQVRAAASGPGASNSPPVAGNYQADNRTGRGDIVGGNKSGHNINLGGLTTIVAVVVVLFFVGKWAVQSTGAPSASDIRQASSCAEYQEITDPAQRTAVINRIAIEISHQGIIGSPFVLSEVDAACATSPSKTIGSVVTTAKGY